MLSEDHPLFRERFPRDGRDISWANPLMSETTPEEAERARMAYLLQLAVETRELLGLDSVEEAAEIIMDRRPLSALDVSIN